MSQRTAQQREQVVVPERAVEVAFDHAQQADEQGLHAGDGERQVAEEDAAAAVEPGVEDGVPEAQAEDGDEDGAIRFWRPEGDVGDPEEEAEPADLDDDPLGVEVPAGGGVGGG